MEVWDEISSAYVWIQQSELDDLYARKNNSISYSYRSLQYAQAQLESIIGSGLDLGFQSSSWFANPWFATRCLLVSVQMRMGDVDQAWITATSVTYALEERIGGWRDSGIDCSVLFGLGGVLQSIWWLRRELGDATFGRDLVLELSTTILREGLQENTNDSGKTCRGLEWTWNGWPYLGAGTGIVGIFFVLLGHTKEEWKDLEHIFGFDIKALVKTEIENLDSYRYIHGGNLRNAKREFETEKRKERAPTVGKRKPGRGRGRNFVPEPTNWTCNWTHGAPGYCLLLLKAFDVFGDDLYFEVARDMVLKTVWPHCVANMRSDRNRKMFQGLSKGLLGSAYVMLAIGRVDRKNQRKWVQRAYEVAQNQQQKLAQTPYAPASSLLEGRGGLAMLNLDLQRFSMDHSYLTHFPFFESCQANPNPRELKFWTVNELSSLTFQDFQRTDLEKCLFLKPCKKASKSSSQKGGISATETAPTEALTTSILTSTQKSRNVPNSSSDSALALDISQLTEPSALAIPQKQQNQSPLPWTNDSTPSDNTTNSKHKQLDPLPNKRQPLGKTNPFSCSDRPTESFKVRAKATEQCQDVFRNKQKLQQKPLSEKHKPCTTEDQSDQDNDYDCGLFITDSVDRIQRAEASWMKHFAST